mmetsp:Transcript_7616/g.15308  ORF Transcript_7616/g.15308 Transcript_7616/m.15308 type:complete len:115 (+) Transcript_7616:1385-1729(+)
MKVERTLVIGHSSSVSLLGDLLVVVVEAETDMAATPSSTDIVCFDAVFVCSAVLKFGLAGYGWMLDGFSGCSTTAAGSTPTATTTVAANQWPTGGTTAVSELARGQVGRRALRH